MNTQVNFQTYENNHKSWVVLIHGLFGNLDNLSSLRRHLSEKYNVLAFDLPNHGKSAWVDEFSLNLCVELLRQTIENNNIAQLSLVGHSLGGKVAMLYALKYPDTVQSLVVADIAPVTYSPNHENVFKGLFNTLSHHLDTRSEFDKALKAHITEPGIRQFLMKSLYKTSDGIWKWRFNVKGLNKDYHHIAQWPDIDKQFNNPTLFIKGANSNYILSEHKKNIAQHFPKARAHIIEGVGHWLHAEKPTVFNKVVERALHTE